MNNKTAVTTLKNKISIKHGFPFKGEYFSSCGSYVVLTPGNFNELGGFKFDLNKAKFYDAEIPEDYICNKGDLIVAMTEQAEGLLGSAAIVPENNRFLHNQRIGLVLVDENKIHKMFLYHLFNTKSVRQQIRGSSSGSKVKHTSPERICDVIVNLPPIVVQQKIAAVLSSLDSKIELNNKINAELEAMAKTLYDYWFVQFDFPDTDGKPYKTSGGKMVWNDELKREIPDGWEIKKISDLLPVITGKQDANFAKENGIYNFFTCGEEILKCYSYEFEGKAVLVAGNGNFNIKLYEGKFNAYQRTYILIPNDPKHYTLVYMAIKDRIDSFTKGSRGSIVKFITKGDIENVQITLPQDGNMDLFSILNTVTKKLEKNILENQNLSELRDWLLPMLMNGQVGVE